MEAPVLWRSRVLGGLPVSPALPVYDEPAQVRASVALIDVPLEIEVVPQWTRLDLGESHPGVAVRTTGVIETGVDVAPNHFLLPGIRGVIATRGNRSGDMSWPDLIPGFGGWFIIKPPQRFRNCGQGDRISGSRMPREPRFRLDGVGI